MIYLKIFNASKSNVENIFYVSFKVYNYQFHPVEDFWLNQNKTTIISHYNGFWNVIGKWWAFMIKGKQIPVFHEEVFQLQCYIKFEKWQKIPMFYFWFLRNNSERNGAFGFPRHNPDGSHISASVTLNLTAKYGVCVTALRALRCRNIWSFVTLVAS